MKKIISILITLLFILSVSFIKTNAAYNYGPNNVVASAESIAVSSVIDSSNLTDTDGNRVPADTYSFGELADVATDGENVYIVDSSNSKILVLDSNFRYVTTFPTAASGETLKSPKGIYLRNNLIYVCDYGNNRVVIFNNDYTVKQIVGTPSDPAFSGYEFKPKKITVNRTGRMFVCAEGINEGIIDFNPDGSFSRYYGMNSVTISGWKAFWLIFTSEKQKEAQGYNFGKSLTNLCIDNEEYVYTVSSEADSATDVIKKLNFRGSDVLLRNGFSAPTGDTEIPTLEDVPIGPSSFVDIDVNDIGTYIALDKNRGRIFAYDFEGNLLYVGGSLGKYVSGKAGTLSGTFQNPEALCYYKNNILVVDSQNKNLVVFNYTDFGSLINEATAYYYENKYEEAASSWEKVLELNTNYYLAYSGVGKAQLRQGMYKEAMKNLKLGYDEYNYSRAYEQYRYQKLSKIVPYIIGGVIILCIFFLGRSVYKNIKLEEREEEGLE